MGNKLLIRAYDVGCGDCIYVCIPDANDGFHLLIDCGSKGGAEPLRKAIQHLAANLLPEGTKPGSRRLDLIVATHRHEDHIKGFDPGTFKDIEVKNIWLSAVMDPAHPQAQKVNQLHTFASQEMRRIAEPSRAMSPEVELLSALYRVSNDTADDLLMKILPQANHIDPKFVHSGQTGKDLGLKLEEAEIYVLAPEKDIDGYYLGEEADPDLRGLQGIGRAFAAQVPEAGAVPQNISAADFVMLRSRMMSNGLAFAAKDSSIQNNMSVVLLIEWKGRRLLFVGDAEWNGEYKEGKQNGSWNVMWQKHRNTHLKKPVDFLKVGHHGSINATPPPASEKKTPAAGGTTVYQILDALLPVPKTGPATAQAIVSTQREFYDPIPEGRLLVELARRVNTCRNYGAELKNKGVEPQTIWATEKARRKQFYEQYEKAFLDQPQPFRTDLESELDKKGFVDVTLEPK